MRPHYTLPNIYLTQLEHWNTTEIAPRYNDSPFFPLCWILLPYYKVNGFNLSSKENRKELLTEIFCYFTHKEEVKSVFGFHPAVCFLFLFHCNFHFGVTWSSCLTFGYSKINQFSVFQVPSTNQPKRRHFYCHYTISCRTMEQRLSFTLTLTLYGMSLDEFLVYPSRENGTLPGSQIQVCLSHWSEQRLWVGHGDDTQGFPTVQPVSTLTVLVGRGRAGASGRTPNRTPCQHKRRNKRRVYNV